MKLHGPFVELPAFCNNLGCTCATGYELSQSSRRVAICRRKTYIETNDDQKEAQTEDEEKCRSFFCIYLFSI